MPYIISFVSTFIAPFIKGLFSSLFSKKTLVILARVAVISAIITLFSAFILLFFGSVGEIIGFFINYLDKFKNTMNGGGGGSSILSCVFYYINFMGLDVVLTSFLSALFSLGVIYFTFSSASIGFVIVAGTKKLIFKSLK